MNPIDLNNNPMPSAQAGIGGSIGKYLTGLFRKGGRAADDAAPDPKKKPDDPEVEPEVEPEGPPQIAPEGAPDTSLNIPRARELVEGMRDEPLPGIATAGRPEDGNLNLRTMTDDPRVKQIADLLNESQDRFKDRLSTQRVSQAQSIAASEDVRVLQRALNKNWDSSWTHEEILALGQMNKEVTILLKEKADEMIRYIDEGTMSGSEEIAFAYLENQAIMVQQKMTDAAAASGRSLQAFRKLQTATNSAEYQQATRELIELQGGSEALRERVRLYAQGKNLEDMYRAKDHGGWNKAKDVIMQIRYNTMLSSVRTHAANITGSSFFTLYENLWIKPMAAGFNKIEQGVRKVTPGLNPMKPEDVMYFRENWAATNSFLENIFVDGYSAKKAWSTFLGREKDPGPTKLSVEGPGRISHATVPESTIGKVATGPTRALEAEDVFFRTLNSRAELARLAYREARTLGETPKDAQRLFNEFMEHPPEHLRKQAQEFGERSTFINDPNTDSRLLATIANGVAGMQQKSMPIQFVVPFVRSPANLMIYAKNNLGLSSRLVTDYFGSNAIKRAEWNARIVSATGLYFLTKNLYDKGMITGVGNPNRSTRAGETATGTNPMNSIRFEDGGEWHQLNRMDPAALSIGMMVTLHEQIAYYEGENSASMDAIVNTLMEVSQLALDRSMLSGVSQVMEVMQGSSSAAKKGDIAAMVAGLPAIASPGILRDIRMMTDPSMREMEPEGSTVTGIGQRIYKRWLNSIPGLSGYLPPRRDWRGDVKEYQGNTFYRGVVPVPITKPMTDKSSMAIVQYGIGIAKVQPKFLIPKTGIPLNTMEIDGGKGWAYNKFQEFVGIERAKLLDKFTGTKSFEKRTNEIIVDGVIVDPFKYDQVGEKLSAAMSQGRRAGVMRFLDWIDGRTEIPGRDGKMIPVDKVINKADYVEFTRAYREGEPIESDVYGIPQRSVSPGTQSVIDQSIEF